MAKQERSKFWAFILYPESCDIMEFVKAIADYPVPYTISPCHDRDLDSDGNVKKAHYHVMLCYDNPISYSTVADFTQKFGTYPIKIISCKAYYSYFTHSECGNKDGKAVYNSLDILSGNGFDISNYITLRKSEQYTLVTELTQYILDNNVVEYADFVKYALSLGSEYFQLACSRTLYFNHLITSLRHERKR